jgi:hypothetical protein
MQKINISLIGTMLKLEVYFEGVVPTQDLVGAPVKN